MRPVLTPNHAPDNRLVDAEVFGNSIIRLYVGERAELDYIVAARRQYRRIILPTKDYVLAQAWRKGREILFVYLTIIS